jgi:hypothetical protein
VARGFPLIVCSSTDTSARRLAAEWASCGARLLRPSDLLRGGWQYFLDGTKPSRGVASRRSFTFNEIAGVYIRTPRISETDLPQIRAADRPFVAAEMTNFLAGWLSTLNCPVLNRPTPSCLHGPPWRTEHWVRAAFLAGIPARAISQSSSPESSRIAAEDGSSVTLIVVGDNCFGAAAATLKRDAIRLARAAGADLLAARFSGPTRHSLFLDADTCPAVDSADVSDAILRMLMNHRSRKRSPASVRS